MSIWMWAPLACERLAVMPQAVRSLSVWNVAESAQMGMSDPRTECINRGGQSNAGITQGRGSASGMDALDLRDVLWSTHVLWGSIYSYLPPLCTGVSTRP
jgi:hypothetical protein